MTFEFGGDRPIRHTPFGRTVLVWFDRPFCSDSSLRRLAYTVQLERFEETVRFLVLPFNVLPLTLLGSSASLL
jgi:hypothetical protein